MTVTEIPAPRAATGFQPTFGRDSVVVFGDTETGGVAFECQVRSWTLTPDVTTEQIKALCPDGVYSDVDDPTWTLELSYLVGESTDDTVPALSEFLAEHHGEKMDVYLRPRRGGPGRHVVVTIVQGPYGIEQGAFTEQSVTLPVDGQPDVLPAEAGS